MKEKKADSNAKECARCGGVITCNSANVEACECSKVPLSTQEFRFISSKYTICVCNSCLIDLKNEFALEFRKKHPGITK